MLFVFESITLPNIIWYSMVADNRVYTAGDGVVVLHITWCANLFRRRAIHRLGFGFMISRDFVALDYVNGSVMVMMLRCSRLP